MMSQHIPLIGLSLSFNKQTKNKKEPEKGRLRALRPNALHELVRTRQCLRRDPDLVRTDNYVTAVFGTVNSVPQAALPSIDAACHHNHQHKSVLTVRKQRDFCVFLPFLWDFPCPRKRNRRPTSPPHPTTTHADAHAHASCTHVPRSNNQLISQLALTTSLHSQTKTHTASVHLSCPRQPRSG